MKPKVRFKGFSGEWKEIRLGEIGDICMCKRVMKNETNTSGPIPFYKIGTFGNEADAFIPEELFLEYKKKYSYPRKGEVLFSAAGTIGRSVVFDGEPAYFQDSNIVWITNSEKIVSNFFLKCAYSIISWNIEDGSIVKRLYNDNIRKTSILIPTLPEQTTIATFFTHLDTLISSTSRRLDKLRAVKAAALQTLFPQEGEKEPRVRFKGFCGEWTSQFASEVFSPIKNNSLSRADLSASGEVMNIHYGDILIKFGECVSPNIDGVPYVRDNSIGQSLLEKCALKNGDVIFADAAEDNTVGTCTELVANKEDKVVSGLHTIACRPSFRFADKYLGYHLNSPVFHDQLLPYIQGSKISSISRKVINNTIIRFPSLPEQTAIANYFTHLDDLIASTSRRLDKLRAVKAACMEGMFV